VYLLLLKTVKDCIYLHYLNILSSLPSCDILTCLCFISFRIQRWGTDRVASIASTIEEVLEVTDKLRVIALKWHHSGGVDVFRASGFEAYLTPFQFKQQIERSFEIILTKEEVNVILVMITIHHILF
jgi:phosphoserine phosphatase